MFKVQESLKKIKFPLTINELKRFFFIDKQKQNQLELRERITIKSHYMKHLNCRPYNTGVMIDTHSFLSGHLTSTYCVSY